jgi:LysR family transcriptional regulator, glycine cleavage system transcriptional activator
MRLPPLSALRAFDASVRHGSFTRAAAELHVTHGAVSRHVAALEAHFGKALFIRHARGVSATEAGRRFYEAVRDALDRLALGAREVRVAEGAARTEISVLPSFATRWLLPRLPRFKRTHPGFEIHLRTEHELVDFRQRAAAPDFAIRYGLGAWKGVHAERLLDENLSPVCSPSARNKAFDIRKLLSRFPLIHDSNEDAWTLWFSCTGIRPPRRVPRALTFSDYNLVLEAAAQGMGVALGRTGLIERNLADGSLVECSIKVSTPRGYHLVREEGEPLRDQARLLWDWLLRAAKQKVAPSVR